MAFISSLLVFYEMRFLYQVFIMLYTEDFSMHHYVRFPQIGSQFGIKQTTSYHMEFTLQLGYEGMLIMTASLFIL